jgi:hypothetical protein
MQINSFDFAGRMEFSRYLALRVPLAYSTFLRSYSLLLSFFRNKASLAHDLIKSGITAPTQVRRVLDPEPHLHQTLTSISEFPVCFP